MVKKFTPNIIIVDFVDGAKGRAVAGLNEFSAVEVGNSLEAMI